MKYKTIWELFLTFMKIGAFTFGGAYAMIPLIQREVCDNKKWMSKEDILDIVAISETTPGPIAINAATFVGYRTSGYLGAFAATFGVIVPSFLIILMLSFLLTDYQNIRILRYAFWGIRIGVLALILKALVSMFKKNKKGIFAYIIMASALVLTAFVKVNAIFVIIGCAVAGLLYTLILRKEVR